MDLSAVKKIMADQPNYRQRQVYEAVYRQLISSWDEATVLPLFLRQQLTAEAPLAIEAELTAVGATKKALITLTDGVRVEAVLIKNVDGRQTVCVSSQAGCALGCVFCATGQAGFKRNLTAAEIVEQVLLFARLLNRQASEGAQIGEPAERIDNIVFMGMGEPFLNWPEVKRAIEIFNDPDGFNIAARSISISTCGLPDGIKELAKFPLQV
ncbi:MAG: radical SAM protein, partial [Patescibacteria group bacterium]